MRRVNTVKSEIPKPSYETHEKYCPKCGDLLDANVTGEKKKLLICPRCAIDAMAPLLRVKPLRKGETPPSQVSFLDDVPALSTNGGYPD